MNYPFWEIPLLSGGLVIAFVAILHVFVSHFAVGGGLFLALMERKAIRESNDSLMTYVKRHSKFFLLLTVVFGAVSGVGIWFTIGSVHPSATSTLIHSFVWGWAIEWTFFFVEIAAVLVYYGTWGKLDKRSHNTVGWIYFIAAFLSMVVINGMLAFMLTPGRWIETRGFWDGFFNPTYFPSLVIRSAVALSLAGLFAQLTASREPDTDLKANIVRYSSKWLMIAMPLFIVAGIWYITQIPNLSWQVVTGGAASVSIIAALSILFSVIIFAFQFFIGNREPKAITQSCAVMFLVLGLLVTGVTEWVREAVRKPYIIYNYMYSNSVLVSERDKYRVDGFLRSSKWSSVKEINTDNISDAGKELFKEQCQSCHTVSGYNAIKPLVNGWTKDDIYDVVGKLQRVKSFMPPFCGTETERHALVEFLSHLDE
jgi:cytochrome bd-type quinol oxidase subunit 1